MNSRPVRPYGWRAESSDVVFEAAITIHRRSRHLLLPLRVRSSGMAFERITVDPAQMGGVPCIRGLRVTVSMVLGQLAAGRAGEQLLEDYPYLEREDVTAALEYAAAIVNEREVPMARPA